jgi:hypothetical protein
MPKAAVIDLTKITFADKKALPARVQTRDPKRVEQATLLATKLAEGAIAQDGVKYATFKAAHLSAMVYRRLLEVGIALTKSTNKPRLRVTQVSATEFTWSVWSEAPAAPKEAAAK